MINRNDHPGQAKHYSQEQEFIDYLKSINYPFEDHTNSPEDSECGYDIVIDGQKYDIKVTDKYLLNFCKLKKNKYKPSEIVNGYTPLLQHLDIPILVVTKHLDKTNRWDGTYDGCAFKKLDLINYAIQHEMKYGFQDGRPRMQFTVCQEDEYYNLCIRIFGPITSLKFPKQMFRFRPISSKEINAVNEFLDKL